MLNVLPQIMFEACPVTGRGEMSPPCDPGSALRVGGGTGVKGEDSTWDGEIEQNTNTTWDGKKNKNKRYSVRFRKLYNLSNQERLWLM